MTLKSILEVCNKGESLYVLSDNRWVFIPQEDGEVDRIANRTVGSFMKYAPEEVLSANVVSFRVSSSDLVFDIECPTSNTIIDGEDIYVGCKPTDWRFYHV